MHTIGLIAFASLFAVSVEAAESLVSESKSVEAVAAPESNANDRVTASPGVTGGFASRALVSDGSAGPVVVRSAGFFSPFPPVTAVGMIQTNSDEDEELRKLMQEVRDRELKLLQNPEYRDFLRAQQRMSLHHSHSDLATLLRLSQEQADQLLALLADQQVRLQVASRAVPPSNRDPQAVQRFFEETQARQRASDSEIAALLGPQKFQEWKEYEQSAMARFQVQRLQQTLPPDARLQPDQHRSLVTIMAREQRESFEGGVRVLPSDGVNDEESQRRMQEAHVRRIASMHQRVLDRATSILSPRQLECFDSLLKQEREATSRQQVFFFGRPAPSVRN